MARAKSQYVCQDCGSVTHRWSGKCDQCGAWNTLVEEAVSAGTPGGLGKKSAGGSAASKGGMRLNLVELTGAADPPPRLRTGDAELDRVTGGGLVPGSALLIGGDPGIGKSTLLLQSAARLARGDADKSREAVTVAYVSGEESVDQVRLRAERLEAADAPVQLAAGTAVRDILATFDGPEAPDLLIIDSIQTMYLDTLESAPGTVAQVRGSAQELIGLAKRRGTALIIVGHVTKEGSIAGPKVVEHMVDAVLHFEGERGHPFRILRAIKNRFGPADEIGVYEMAGDGLAAVTNPSSLFLGARGESGPVPSGTAVYAGIEGSRPVLVEIQALVNPSPLGTPRRTVVGWDTGRLAMVLAVLESRCGINFASQDVFLNVAGGLRLTEPAADLAVAAALVSSISKQPVPGDTVLFGEIGLTGEVRPVPLTPQRLKEAAKLGFDTVAAPFPPAQGKAKRTPSGLNEHHVNHVSGLMTFLGVSRRRKSDEEQP